VVVYVHRYNELNRDLRSSETIGLDVRLTNE